MKRLLDFTSAFVGLVLLGPVLMAVWIAIVLETGLPGLFRQQRVGRHGRNFQLFKFRTMAVKHGTEHGSFDAGSSARVTRVGKLLRKTKLDELPQLWNVLTGDMALVGPRPEVCKWVAVYPERWAKVLTVRPGITDPASIVYRDEEEILARSADPERAYRDEILPHKLSLYEEYVHTRSFFGDIGIIFKTLKVVLKVQ
ncbi:MAG: sugar transferase [Desulfuromonadales bacterium]